MAVSRAAVVDGNFVEGVRAESPRPPRTDLDAPVRSGTELTARNALRLFEAQVESRLLDLLARELKTEGQSFYTIGSSGHEGSAAVADAMQPGDMAFLHYRSGAFYCARAGKEPGPDGAFDVILGMVASSDERIAGGRHKVFGSVDLGIPPQTSTIASHLPKALGYAVALDRKARLEGRTESSIAMCSFGDASSNHSTAAGALNAAAWAAYQNVPAPVLFVCEDNGYGISVRTPRGWVAHNYASRADIPYFYGDGLDLPNAWDAAQRAVRYVRERRRPAFLHLQTIRMLGHAGSDVEQLYRTMAEIEAAEARDPVLATARLLVREGWMQPEEVVRLYESTRARLRRLADEAVRRPKLTTAEQVMQPLAPDAPEAVAEQVAIVAPTERRQAHFRRLPEAEERPRHLAVQLNRCLHDLLLAYPEAVLFGEDVAKKGGVYHVTADLTKRFGVGRVFNTLLDETTILGLAIGAGHAGLLPFPEIQYLAYLMNAIDQLRGEAGSMQFFSNAQYANPMVVRIAGLAYQRGFGGHFHNDNGIAALREIPGLLIGCPARGDDAVRMLRTLAATARGAGRPTVFLEPIALYMTKDLHEDGDGAWLTPYPAPGDAMPVGEVGVYHGEHTDLCIATYANGLYMTLRVVARLQAEGIRCRVIDLRWLSPLPIDALRPHAEACGKLLVVDECRANSGIADTVVAEVVEQSPGVLCHRVQGRDSYIPLGAAANLVLVQEDDIERGIRRILEVS
jgi:2-oxoisovalerate dehydrogenase E1 component